MGQHAHARAAEARARVERTCRACRLESCTAAGEVASDIGGQVHRPGRAVVQVYRAVRDRNADQSSGRLAGSERELAGGRAGGAVSEGCQRTRARRVLHDDAEVDCAHSRGGHPACAVHREPEGFAGAELSCRRAEAGGAVVQIYLSIQNGHDDLIRACLGTAEAEVGDLRPDSPVRVGDDSSRLRRLFRCHAHEDRADPRCLDAGHSGHVENGHAARRHGAFRTAQASAGVEKPARTSLPLFAQKRPSRPSSGGCVTRLQIRGLDRPAGLRAAGLVRAVSRCRCCGTCCVTLSINLHHATTCRYCPCMTQVQAGVSPADCRPGFRGTRTVRMYQEEP